MFKNSIFNKSCLEKKPTYKHMWLYALKGEPPPMVDICLRPAPITETTSIGDLYGHCWTFSILFP